MYSICKPKVCLGPIRCSGCFHFFKIIDNEGWCVSVCVREREKKREYVYLVTRKPFYNFKH